MKKHTAMFPAYLWDKEKMKIDPGETVTLSDDGSMYTVMIHMPDDMFIGPYNLGNMIYYDVDGEVVVDRDISRVIPYRFCFKIRLYNFNEGLYDYAMKRVDIGMMQATFNFSDGYCTLECKDLRNGCHPSAYLQAIPTPRILFNADIAFDRHTNKFIKNRYHGTEYKDIFNEI